MVHLSIFCPERAETLTNAGVLGILDGSLLAGNGAAGVADTGLEGLGKDGNLAHAKVHVGLSASLSSGVVHDAVEAGQLLGLD